MNGALGLARSLIEDVSRPSVEISDEVDRVICPPAVYLASVSQILGTDAPIALGAQNVSEHPAGAYTGEVSSSMLKDVGCEYVIVGHSERRQYHHESDSEVARKAKSVVDEGMIAIICVGETLEERQANETRAVIERQLDAVCEVLDETALSGSLFAYEPVWAIGTGLSASPEQAQEVHGWIREKMGAVSQRLGESSRILYGGSVNGANASSILEQPDVDGCLVGGASLNSIEFLKICSAAA